MIVNRSNVAAKAIEWLCAIELGNGVEEHFLRLFALSAAEVLLQKDLGAVEDRLTGLMPDLTENDYGGDPVLAICVFIMIKRRGLTLPALANLVEAYATTLRRGSERSEVALVVELVRQAGSEIGTPEPPPAAFYDEVTGITGDRDRMLEICRGIAMKSAWGQRPIDAGKLKDILPSLAVSYAIDWDLEAVTTLLRCCAYIGAASSRQTQWTTQWLEDQQQADGRFGLFAPEAARMGNDANDWRLYFGSTVSSLWALADVCHPGFFLTRAPVATNNQLLEPNHKVSMSRVREIWGIAHAEDGF